MTGQPPCIRDAKGVYEAFKGIARHRKERVYAVPMEGDEGNVLGIEEVSRGSDGLVDASPDLVYRPAQERGCASLIVVHKHPRDSLTPPRTTGEKAGPCTGGAGDL